MYGLGPGLKPHYNQKKKKKKSKIRKKNQTFKSKKNVGFLWEGDQFLVF
jgi:hypothetical protein